MITILLPLVYRFVRGCWHATNPAFSSIADYMVAGPMIYGLCLLSHYVIGDTVVRRVKKVVAVIVNWVSVISLCSFILGTAIKCLEAAEKDYTTFGGEIDPSVRVLSMSCAILSCVMVCILIGAHRYVRREKVSIMTAASKEVVDKGNGESPELTEIWTHIKSELRKVREEVAAVVAEQTSKNKEKADSKVNEVKMENPIAYPVEEKAAENVEMITEGRTCGRCGGPWHKISECPYRKLICRNCGLRGHKATMCRHVAQADTRGRIVTRMENRPGSVKLYHRRDRTQSDALDTGEGVLELLHQALRRKALKEKQRRLARRESRSSVKAESISDMSEEPLEKPVEPVNKESEFTEVKRKKKKSKSAKEEQVLLARIAGPVEPIRVNGIRATWLVDTGATRAIVNKKEARRLNLIPLSSRVKLEGIGRRSAMCTRPVKLLWQNRSCNTSPYIVDDLEIPGLLGMEEAKKLGMIIRPRDGTVSIRLATVPVGKKEALSEETLAVESNKDKEREKQIFERISADLTVEQQKRVWEVILQHKKVWTSPRFGCVKTKAQFEAIDRPVKDKVRPMSAELKKELENQVKELLESKVIRPSKSPWAASPVFVRKADGSWRMALDYRRVNKRIRTDGYPLPLLWEQLQKAAGYLYYAKMDGKSGFFNVPLTESSKALTAFNTHIGLYEYNVLPFGIKNSPGEFQRVMDNTLSEMYGRGVLCYIDDIVIYSNNFEQWLSLINEVFVRLWKAGIFVEGKKCEFGPSRLPILGHILTSAGIWPNPRKVEAIRQTEPPKDRKELMSFLGLIGFVKRFIPSYSEKTLHIGRLLRKNIKYVWSEDCQREYDELKKLVSEHVMLSVPASVGPYVIITDASDYAIGSVLCQWSNKELRVLEFASKRFADSEINWSTREKEAFAIKWSVQRYEDYIKGAKIYVLTDHQSLQWMDKAASGKVQRWALYLQQFDIRVRAISGRDNGMADWLSRSIVNVDKDADAEIESISVRIPMYTFMESESEGIVAKCPYLPTLEQWEEASLYIPTEDSSFIKKAEDGLWYSVHGHTLYVPPPLRESILFWFHAGKYGAHLGINRTYKRMLQWFYWPRMKTDVVKYVNSCLPCKRLGAPNIRYLKQVFERAAPFQMVSCDHVGPREWNNRRYYYLVMIDHCTRFMVTHSVEGLKSEDTISIVRKLWVNYFGAPEAVLVDRGSQFTSKGFQHFVVDELNAHLVYSGPGYPQGNAVNESSHKGIEASLGARLLCGSGDSFETALRDATMAYNATPHSATGYSPFYALYGKPMIIPGLQRFEQLSSEASRRANQKEVLMQFMQREILNRDRQLRLYTPSKLEVGDSVVYYLQDYEKRSEHKDEGRSLIKYSPEWSPPTTVLDVHPNTVTIISNFGRPLKISRRLVRKVGLLVPPSLQQFALRDIEKKSPNPKVEPDWKSPLVHPRKRVRFLDEDELSVKEREVLK